MKQIKQVCWKVRVFKNYPKLVKGERTVILSMANKLPLKGFQVVPGHVLCSQCVKEFDVLVKTCQHNSDPVQH